MLWGNGALEQFDGYRGEIVPCHTHVLAIKNSKKYSPISNIPPLNVIRKSRCHFSYLKYSDAYAPDTETDRHKLQLTRRVEMIAHTTDKVVVISSILVVV